MKIDTVLEYTVRFLAIGILQIHPVIKISPRFQNGRHFLHTAVGMLNQVHHRISKID